MTTTTMHRAAMALAAMAAMMVGCNSAPNTPVDGASGGDASDIAMGSDVIRDVPASDTPASSDVPAADDAANCGAHTDCLACTQDALCGWCASSNTCFVGDSTGPTGGPTCAGAMAWQYYQSDCPNYDAGPQPDVAPIDCTTFTTCADCTGASSCGWCAGSSSCLSGTSAGSTTGACMTGGTAWSWTSDMCPGTGTDAGGPG